MKKIRIVFIVVVGFIFYTILLSSLTRFVSLHESKANAKLGSFVTNSVVSLSYPIRLMDRFFSKEAWGMLSESTFKDGFTYFANEKNAYSKVNILTSYQNDRYGNIIDLYNLETGNLIKKWAPDGKEISLLSRDEKSNLFDHAAAIYLTHPLLLKDSSVVFSPGGYALGKIDADSKILWVRNDYQAHHSIELDYDENIWICGRRKFYKSNFKGIIQPIPNSDGMTSEFLNDLIMKINPKNGEVMYEKPIMEILIENNLEDILYKSGNVDKDATYLNDVQPALSDGEFWKKDDLLLSLRNISMVILYRPSTNKVIWYHQGTWYRQHDADFYENNKIVVFGNQVFVGGDAYIKHPSDFSSVFVYDFETDKISEPYKKMIESEKIKSETEGRSDILPNGDVYIEDTNHGRLVFGDATNKKVEFVKRINKNGIAYLHWSRIILN